MTPEDLRRQRIRAFLQLAEEEFDVAVTLRDKHGRQAAYFLQQSVEKLLRSLLEIEGVPVGTMHNLRTMADMLPEGHRLYARFAALDELSPAATRYRYPSPKGTVSEFDTRKFDRLMPEIEALINDARALIRDALAKH